jgi:zinc protease
MNTMKNLSLLIGIAFSFALPIQGKAQKVKHTAFSTTKQIAESNLFKATLIEKVDKKAGEDLVIPYSKYVLPNGLTLIVHEDHSDPVVYVDVTYHVGSNREQEGRSGFAHFFEHMMFQGSKNVGDEQHFKIVNEAGGVLNGTTNTDRTNYFQTVPSNQLEVMLWLESDRMGFLLDSVTQSKFEVQRATVKNERGQRYDNAPYGLSQEKLNEAFYPQGHPYSWQTIGYIEDLNRVDVNDLKRFYMRWYGPNNAVLTISGDVNTEVAVRLAEKYFGSIQKGPEVKKLKPIPSVLPDVRFISYEDNVRFPQLRMAYPTVESGHPDEKVLDALNWILSHGKASPFYTTFIKTQKASAATSFHFSSELAGQFNFMIMANPGTALAETYNDVQKVLSDWENKGIQDELIERYKTKTYSQMLNRLNTVQGKGGLLALYQTFYNNPNYLAYEMSQIKKITKEDVLRVYFKYIKNKNHVVLSVVPKGKPDLTVKPDSWKMYNRNIQSESEEYKNLKYVQPKDNFDRKVMPKATKAPAVHLPEYWTENVSNGVKLIGAYSDEVPKVNIQISLRAGHRFEEKEKSGLSLITSDILNEATLNRSAEQISEELDGLGANIDVSGDADEITLFVSALPENLNKTLILAEDILLHPKFDPVDFERAKKHSKDLIAQRTNQPAAIADRIFSQILFGKNHIMSMPLAGTLETIDKITLEDVKKFYAEEFSPLDCHVVIGGMIQKEQVVNELGFLKNWKSTAVPDFIFPELPSVQKTKLYFIDKKGAAQSEIRIGFPFIKFDATDEFYKATLANYAFAGSFNSRLNLLLREKRGFTYGVRGAFNGNAYDGNYTIAGGFKASATDSSLIDILEQINLFVKNGITEEELLFTRHSINQGDAIKFEAPQQKSGYIKKVLEFNLPANYVHQQIEILDKINVNELNQLIRKHFNPEKLIIVIVGDKQSCLEKLQKTGFEIIELDTQGNMLK